MPPDRAAPAASTAAARPVAVASGQDHAGALVEQPRRHRLTDEATAADDQRPLALQPEIHRRTVLRLDRGRVVYLAF
jgi:hypothetical protein